MGGNALGPAVRLTSAQHAALERFCRRRLAGHFDEIVSPPYLRDKDTHGDLDLVCAFHGCEIGRFERGVFGGRLPLTSGEIEDGCGGEGALSHSEEVGPGDGVNRIESTVLSNDTLTLRQPAEHMNCGEATMRSRPRGGRGPRMTAPAVLESAAAAIGGTEWRSRSNEIMLANVSVPVSVLTGEAPCPDSRESASAHREETTPGTEDIEDNSNPIWGVARVAKAMSSDQDGPVSKSTTRPGKDTALKCRHRDMIDQNPR